MTTQVDPRRSHCGRAWTLIYITIFAAALIASVQTASAQGYARINGIVTDASGAAVAGAKITATQVGTGVATTTTTNSEGVYTFPSLKPSTYDLSVTSSGFATTSRTGVILQADSAVTVNVSLKVGNVDQNITVEATPVQVDTSTATLSQVVEQRKINDLPLNTRNAATLTTLVAGVVIAPTAQTDQGQTKSFPVVVVVTANGSRAGQTNYMLDGGNNLDEYTNVNAPFPFPDALQEFSVQTSNYNAEYGQNAGGVVNIVTKSGTNQFHGNLFEYNRNAAYNASNYFSNPGGTKDPLKRNQFGGTIGGPFKLPGVSTPHSYFFAGYQKTIVRNSPLADSAATVPTATQLAGNFDVANSSQCLKNPFTGALYPCTATATTPGVSTIDPATFDKASVALTKFLPDGGTTGLVNFRRPVRQNFDEITGRFDQDIGQKDKLYARYFYNRFHADGVLDLKNLLTYADQATIVYQNILVNETHSFSDRVLNNFSLSYAQENSGRGPLDGAISVVDLGVNIWNPTFKQINQIQLNGGGSTGFNVGDNPAATFKRNNYSLKDDIRWVTGNHSLAFGFQGEYTRINLINQFQQPGAFTFNSTDNSTAASAGMANFLLGYMASFNQQSGQLLQNHGKFLGWFAQDNWKINRKFSLNFGLRYEPFLPWHEVQGRDGAFSPTNFANGVHSTAFPNAPIGLIFPGDTGMVEHAIRAVYTDFMPRLGFAWDVFGDGKTSLRGGAGIFYDTRVSGVFNNIYSNGSPYVTKVGVTAPAKTIDPAITFSNPYTATTNPNPFPSPLVPPKTQIFSAQNYFTFDPYNEFQPARTFNWNLTLERQLSGSSLARIAYVASRSNHLWAPIELNYTHLDTSVAGSHESPRLYAPVYSQQITKVDYGQNSFYNSLQATFEHRFSHGFSALANYTWAKSLDDMPANASATAIAQDQSYAMPTYMPDFRQLDYGPSDFDRRHVFSLSYVWDLPKVGNSWGPAQYILNGWQTNGIMQFRTGGPITVLSSGNDNSKSSQRKDRAVMIGDPYGGNSCAGALRCVNYLNAAAFTANAEGTYGNVKKGSVVGPGYADWDVSLIRRFTLTERWKLDFRAEYFNVLNHPNYNDPATNTLATWAAAGANGASGFGRITGAMDPRIGQLSLKLNF